MQTERSKKGSYLFCSLLDAQKVRSFVNLNEQLLLKAIKMSSKQFSRALQNSDRKIYLFLANYKLIMQEHSKTISNFISVNLSLHFALLFTETLVRESNYSYAKTILKQTEDYLQIEDCDPMLLSICLNNLAILYCRTGKYKKGLIVALKGISIVQEHLDELHTMKMKKRTVQDGVVFVNLLLVGKRSIEKLLARSCPDKNKYQRLLKIINKIGYHFSSKYLGQNSLFTSKFEFHESTIDLPIYDSSEQTQKESNIGFQMHVAQQLAHIYDILKNLKLEPEVYYIREQLVPQNKNQEDSDIQPDPALLSPSVEDDMNVSYVETLIIDDWNTQLSILKSNGSAEDKEYIFIGYLKFSFTKGRKIVKKIILQQNMRKIINVINITDVQPYEIDLRWMSSQQFIKKIFINYLSVSSEGDFSVFPRAKSIIQPIQMKFCGEKSIILLNHIQFRRFRLAICPHGTSETIYLQIHFKNKHISDMITIYQSENLFMKNQEKKYNSSNEYGQKPYVFAQTKHIQLIANHFRLYITKIIQLFQQFIDQQQQNKLQDIRSFVSYPQNYLYYQYTDFNHNIGRFHSVKYRSNSNHFEVSVKNTYKTHSSAGLKMAKGVGIYSPQQFQKDFSLVLKHSRRYLGALSEIILQKFTLKEYENPLAEEEEDLYQENAITEIPIISKTYLRKFIWFQSYFLPVTIQVITINNEKPVGIRVNAYEPTKSNNSGLFIYITPEFWERPEIKSVQESDQSINDKVKRIVQDYNFKKCYFIADWMQQQGFQLIFSRLSIVNRALEVDNAHGRFIVLEELFPK